MSLVSLAEVRALVKSNLSDSDLQAVIDREEGWLATRIGLLSGSRTETLYPRRGAEHLHLRRSTSSVTVTDDGDAVDVGDDYGDYRLLYSGTVVERVGTDWGIKVAVTYEPNDSAAVKAAIIDLIRLRMTDTGFVAERIGQYSYQTAQAPGAREQTRRAVVDGLLLSHCPLHRSERLIAAAHP
jgi:hypothetical protein